ncbi:MAG TPA: hypothetical protein IAA58_05985 [Candidatus Gallacutalibacter stercoravium]|nr:hypothetical protein [Candidatus Gallacutalibacter stercoravium]
MSEQQKKQEKENAAASLQELLEQTRALRQKVDDLVDQPQPQLPKENLPEEAQKQPKEASAIAGEEQQEPPKQLSKRLSKQQPPAVLEKEETQTGPLYPQQPQQEPSLKGSEQYLEQRSEQRPEQHPERLDEQMTGHTPQQQPDQQPDGQAEHTHDAGDGAQNQDTPALSTSQPAQQGAGVKGVRSLLGRLRQRRAARRQERDEDAPDEMMLKYGDLGLLSHHAPEGGAQEPVNADLPEDGEDDALPQNFSSIIEKIQWQRRQDDARRARELEERLEDQLPKQPQKQLPKTSQRPDEQPLEQTLEQAVEQTFEQTFEQTGPSPQQESVTQTQPAAQEHDQETMGRAEEKPVANEEAPASAPAGRKDGEGDALVAAVDRLLAQTQEEQRRLQEKAAAQQSEEVPAAQNDAVTPVTSATPARPAPPEQKEPPEPLEEKLQPEADTAPSEAALQSEKTQEEQLEQLEEPEQLEVTIQELLKEAGRMEQKDPQPGRQSVQQAIQPVQEDEQATRAAAVMPAEDTAREEESSVDEQAAQDVALEREEEAPATTAPPEQTEQTKRTEPLEEKPPQPQPESTSAPGEVAWQPEKAQEEQLGQSEQLEQSEQSELTIQELLKEAGRMQEQAEQQESQEDGEPEPPEPSLAPMDEPGQPPIPQEQEKPLAAENMQNTREFRLLTPENRYEKHFGKLPPARAGQTEPDEEQEDPQGQQEQPSADEAAERHGRIGGRITGKRREQLPPDGEAQQADIPVVPLEGESFLHALRQEYTAYEQYESRFRRSRIKEETGRAEQEDEWETGSAPGGKKKKRFAIFGSTEEDNDPGEEPRPEEQPPELEDYNGPQDAMLIKGNLVGGVRRSFVRLLLMGAALLLLLAATVLQRLPVPALQEFSAQLPMFYLVFDFVLLVGACAAGYPILRSGLSALVRLKGTSDSALSFAALAALVQQAAAFTAPWRFSVESGLNVYAVLVVLGLFLSSWGKFVMVRRVQENFKFVSSPDAKYAARIYTDEAQATKMCKGLVVGSPVMAYQQPTDLLSHFLQLSYEPDPSEKLAGKASVFSTLACLILAGAYFAFSRDILAALSVLAVAACVCTPLCAALAVNLPIKSLCKKAAGMGAMLSGYPAVRQFCDVNAVVLDAQELYPAGSVVLHGIKGFSGQRIDEAILQASAVMQQVGGPMSSTFDQIIKGKSEMLPKVESVVYEDEMGLVAWVGGQRVLLGNRRLLEEHGIMPPSRDYERQYKKDGRQLTYLATAGELVAMFVLSYTPNEEMAAQMRALEDHGVSFLVRTVDPNVTAKMVCEHFGVFFRSVKIMQEEHAQLYAEATQPTAPRVRAYLATKGACRPFLRMLAACMRIRSNASLSLVLQAVGVVLGILLVLLLVAFSGLGQLGALEMAIYELFWVLAVLIVPSLRRP